MSHVKQKINPGKKKGITIENLINPATIKRLYHDKSIFASEIKDFRAMIDCVLIDNDYNGKVFNIVYGDVPKKKRDLAQGKCPIEGKGKVAVKIIDMLGERDSHYKRVSYE